MIWAVDGPDKVGKTTALLNAVQDKTYQVYVHSSNWPGTYRNWTERLDAIVNLGLDTAMDRFFLSEIVYSEFRGDEPLMDLADANALLYVYRRELRAEVWLPKGVESPLNEIYERRAELLRIPVRYVHPI